MEVCGDESGYGCTCVLEKGHAKRHDNGKGMSWPCQAIVVPVLLPGGHGESLVGFPGRGESAVECRLDQGDSHAGDLRVALHGVCRGAVTRVDISSSHFALTCQRCALRVVVPVQIKVWADLLAWAEAQVDREHRSR